jgi:hypothetical protein
LEQLKKNADLLYKKKNLTPSDLQQIQNYIIWHYTYGSKYNTTFWKTSEKLKIKDPEFDRMLELSKKFSIVDLLNNDEHYGQWKGWNFKCWHDGMTCKQ